MMERKGFWIQTYRNYDESIPYSFQLFYVPDHVMKMYAQKMNLKLPLRVKSDEEKYAGNEMYKHEHSVLCYAPFKVRNDHDFDLVNYPFTDVQRAYVIDQVFKSLFVAKRQWANYELDDIKLEDMKLEDEVNIYGCVAEGFENASFAYHHFVCLCE